MCNITRDPVKGHIKHPENRTPAVVISVEAAHVSNVDYLEYLASVLGLQEPDIGSTVPNIRIDTNSTDDEHHFAMPGVSGHDEQERDECDNRNTIPTASQQ
jgi:hypothetical protein